MTSSDIIKAVNDFGISSIVSNLTYFTFSDSNELGHPTKNERDLYFLIENAKNDLYDKVQLYVDLINDQVVSEIEQNIKLTMIVNYTCVGMIALAGILIIPLFGRIQNRIQALMNIFF